MPPHLTPIPPHPTPLPDPPGSSGQLFILFPDAGAYVRYYTMVMAKIADLSIDSIIFIEQGVLMYKSETDLLEGKRGNERTTFPKGSKVCMATPCPCA